MKKIINCLICCSLLLQATDTPATSTPKVAYTSADQVSAEDKTKMAAPLKNIFTTTAWGTFLQEFEMNFKVGTCGTAQNAAIGFKTHSIEPIGYMETTKKPLSFPFAQIELDGSLIKSCPNRADSKEESARDECYYNHFIFAPLFGMIFKKSLKLMCFHQGNIVLPFLAEFDPTHLKDALNYKTIPHMIAMISPQAILSSVLDCAAVSSLSTIRGYSTNSQGNGTALNADQWATKYDDPDQRQTNSTSTSVLQEKGIKNLEFIINSMYYNLGCEGMFPVGGYSEGQDPGIDAGLLAYSTMNKLHGASTLTQIPILQKQTDSAIELSSDLTSELPVIDPGSTWCKPKDSLIGPKAQYGIQLAGIPTTAGMKEQGESGLVLTSFTNLPDSKDSYVYVYWQRRDYLAGAYQCYDKPIDTSSSN